MMMKTLEQWQKELPDYEFSQSLGEICQYPWEVWEVREGDTWHPIEQGGDFWGAFIDGTFIRSVTLILLGATFRRKKERQRKFKIEFGNSYQRVMIDGETMCLCQLHRSGKFPAGTSATLTVNEWGGE